MVRALLSKELKSRRWYFVGALVAFCFIATIVPYSYLNTLPLLQNILFASFVWASWWGQPLWQMGFIFVLLLAVTSFDSENREGVMEFLLSRNVSPGRILTAKVAADMVVIWLVACVSTAILYISASCSGIGFDPPYSFVTATAFTSLAFLLPYSVSLVATLVSRNKVVGFSTGLLWVVSDLLLLISIKEELSLIYYMIMPDFYMQGGFPWVPAAFVLILASLLTGGAYRGLSKREL